MLRILALVTLLGAGCAARTDRAAVAPAAAVAIAPDLAVTCGRGSQDHFAYAPAPSDPTPCGAVDDAAPLEPEDPASAGTRARDVAQYLSGEPADPPVDRRTLAAAMRRAATSD